MKLGLLLLILIHWQCATILLGKEETFRVKSQVLETDIYINNEKKGTNFVTFSFPKKETLILRVHKDGCKDFQYEVKKHREGKAIFGIFLDFGLISIIVIDWLVTGAIWTSENTNFILDPDCGNSNISQSLQ